MKADIKNTPSTAADRQDEIDLVELFRKGWSRRRQIVKVSAIAFCVAVVIALSIPREYTSTVMLANEQSGASSGSMSALASMAGINMGNTSSQDALSPAIYPQIIGSTPFLIDLVNTEVTAGRSDYSGTFYNYLDTEIRSAWWKPVLAFPMKVISSIFSGKGDMEEADKISDPVRLTAKQSEILAAASERITVNIDEKSGITEMSVKVQDPLVSAMVADTLLKNLQSYITQYRTNKASEYLKFVEQQSEEAKANMLTAQRVFSDYADGNHNAVVYRRNTEQIRLEGELKIAAELYGQSVQQVALAKAKVAEQTPVFTVIEPAKVPVKASAPRKAIIVIGITFLGFACAAMWALFGRDFVRGLRTGIKEEHDEGVLTP